LANERDFFEKAGACLQRNKGKTLFLIFVFALAIRAAVTLSDLGNAPIPSGSDANSYDAFAREIVGGDWLGRPVSYRAVGYPFFLSLVYRTLGDSPVVARLSNAVLGAVTCLLIFFLADKIFGFNVAILASIWSIINAQFLFLNTMIIRETLVTFLLVAFLLTLCHAYKERSRWYLAAAALLLVLLIHTDARYLFHVPFVAFYFFVTVRGFRRSTAQAAVFLLVFMVGMIPWQYRNYKAYDRFVLIDTWTLEMPFPWQEDATPVPLRLTHPSKHVKPPENARQLTGIRRVIYDFNEFYRVFRIRGELKNRTDTYDKPWSTRHNVSSILTYGLVLPFFIFGVWIVLRERRREAYILVIAIFAHTLLHVIKFALPRYRAPVEPAIIILGMLGLIYAWSKFKDRRQGNDSLETA
jgi:4-amino-4-deoxy-L-arabinose transferase-like glycosyltransferase